MAVAPVEAYIGPGAGFALVSSFFVLFTTIVAGARVAAGLAVPMLLARAAAGSAATPLIRRLIVVGFDGQEPTLTERFMAEGKLPNFASWPTQGSYRRLRTTFPAVSPVAWSSFSTGVQPARHNIFDFLDRDRRTYLPVLSSTRIGTRRAVPEARALPDSARAAGAAPAAEVAAVLDDPRRAAHLEHDAARADHVSTGPFYGAQLSAMCVPDLLGTQGTFLLYTTRPAGARFKEGGMRVAAAIARRRVETAISRARRTASSRASRRSSCRWRFGRARDRRACRRSSGATRSRWTPGG